MKYLHTLAFTIFLSFNFTTANAIIADPTPPEISAPPTCQQWFDGCNNCRRESVGSPLICTQMACFRPSEPECLKFFDTDKPLPKTAPKLETKILVFDIAPNQEPCPLNETGKCLIVDGKPFGEDILGFQFKEGVRYRIRVLQEPAFDGEVPEGESPYDYTLVEILEKDDPNEIKDFTDVDDNSDFAKAIKKLQADKIIKGYDDGTYKPRNRINRAEFLTLLMRATGKDFEGANCFKDVTDQWFAPAVCTAKEMGIIEGYSDGNFKPDRRINIAEASKIIDKILEISTDESLNQNWYQKFLKALEAKKAIPDSIFSADQEISRGEMAEVVWRVRENITDKPTQKYETIAADLPQFESCADFGHQLKKSKKFGQPVFYDDFDFLMMRSEGVQKNDVAMPTSMPMLESKSKSANFSETNVQVSGVDEADIVKTDGKYLYYLRNKNLEILKAHPAADMEKISTIKLPKNFTGREILLRGNQLIVLGTSYTRINYDKYQINNAKIKAMPAIWPPRGGYNRNRTTILIYDITDKSNPIQAEKLSFDGNYQTVRRIKNQLYLVTTESIWDYGIKPMELLPNFQRNTNASKKLVNCGSVRYIPGQNLRQYTSFIAINLDDLDATPKQEVVFGGNSGSVYMSTQNAYITSPFYQDGRFSDWNWQTDQAKTNIFKFRLNNGDIAFEKKGQVIGNLLNQFSMDENKGFFRVATTTQGNILKNHVFVLNPQMEIVGQINDIAPGEKIYSTRFIGDRLYMVTFRTIDPLFVIDLKNPKKPKILGKLKVPGYSNYLHPYDENHLIGFGKDTTESKDKTRAFYEGIKIALFDVTDVNHPKQKFQFIIGDRGTDSEILSNHKALMWDNERKLIGFPIQIAKVTEEDKKSGSTWGRTEFSGAMVFKVSLDKGFEKKATITHYTADDLLKMGDHFPMDYAKNIQRILYIGNTLYTLSQKKVKATDLTSGKDISTVILQDDRKEKYYPRPMPLDDEPPILEGENSLPPTTPDPLN